MVVVGVGGGSRAGVGVGLGGPELGRNSRRQCRTGGSRRLVCVVQSQVVELKPWGVRLRVRVGVGVRMQVNRRVRRPARKAHETEE